MKNQHNNDKYIAKASLAGLSAKASLVYVIMLEHRLAIAPKSLITKTALHRQYVYDALKELQQKNLVNIVENGKSTKYIANNPKALNDQAEKKRLEVLDSVQALQELYQKSSLNMTEVVYGKELMYESEMRILYEAEQESYLDIIGGAGTSFLNMMGEDGLKENEAMRIQKKIKIRYITSKKDTPYLDNFNKTKTQFYEVRFLENLNDSINICIRPSEVSFNIYDPELMTVRVRSNEVVASQSAIFETLWAQASEV